MNNRKPFYAVSLALILVAVLIVVKAVLLPQFFPAPGATQAVSDLAPEDFSAPYLKPANTPDEPEMKKSEMKVEADSIPAAQTAVKQQQVPVISNPPAPALELKGTITGPTRMASAIITDTATGSTGTYKIGDRIGGGRLVAIEKDGVLIDFDGQTIELESNTPDLSKQSAERGISNAPLSPPINSDLDENMYNDALRSIKLEKMRAGYLYIEDNTNITALMREQGLNTVIIKDNFYSEKKYFDTEKVKDWVKACKKEEQRLYMAYNWSPGSKLKYYRSVIYANGETGNALCPREHQYWNDIFVVSGKRIAELSIEPGIQLDGIFLDYELYGTEASRRRYGDEACYCEDCFKSFLRSQGYQTAEIPTMEPERRKNWLENNNFLDRYKEFLAQDVENLAEHYEQELHASNPNLIIGMYPTPSEWVLQSVARGLGDADSPLLIFGTDTYEGGGHKSIPHEPENFYKNMNIDCLYSAGFLLSKYSPEKLSLDLYTATEKCRGYWLWTITQLVGGKHTELLVEGTIDEYWNKIKEVNRDISSIRDTSITLAEKVSMLSRWQLANPGNIGAGNAKQQLPEINLRGKQCLLIYTRESQDTELDLYFKRLGAYIDNLKYQIFSEENQVIKSAVISQEGITNIRFHAGRAGTFLLAIDAGRCMYRVISSNSPVGILDSYGLNTLGRVDRLYFPVAADIDTFVILGERDGQEDFSLTVRGPDNTIITTSTGPYQENFRLEIPVPSSHILDVPIWSLTIDAASTSVLEDAWFNFIGAGDVCLSFKPEWVFIRN